MALDLLINTSDPQQRGLIASILDGGIAPFPNFTRNDQSVAITIQPVVPSTGDTRSFDVDYTTGDTYQVSIGSADEAPTAGTFALSISSVTTNLTALAYNVTAAALQTPLTAAAVAGGNPAVTVTLLSTGVYQVDGVTNGALATIVADTTNLIPVCSAVVTVVAAGNGSTKGQQIIRLVQQPAAYATPSTALPTASVTVTTEQAASSTLNQIIRIAFATGTYGGLYSLSATVNGVTAVCGSVSPVASIGELSSVLGRHPQLRYNSASAPNNFTVSTDGPAYLVEFIGNIGAPATPTLSATNVSLLAPFGASGTISLNTVNMAKMFWASGVDSLALTLSVVRTRTSGEVKTIFSIPVIVPADIINAGSLTTISVSGAVRYDISQSLSAAEKLQAVTNQGLNLTASKLLGQASSGGTGLPVAITLGTNLSMSGTTLNAVDSATGTVTSVSVTTANGVSGAVATATTTPAISLTLGAITPTSVAAVGAVTGSNLSGTNTGDQTSVTGNAGTATALATARNIFNISFNGTANVAGDATNTGHFASIPGTGAAGHFITENGTVPTLIAGRSAWYSNGSGVPSFKNGTGTAVTFVISSDLGTNVATFLATPSAANLAAAVTGETGTGALVFATSPTLVTPALGTPSSGTLTNCTFPTLNQNTSGSAASLSISGQTGLLTFTGLASTNQIKTVRDAADTMLELGGTYTTTGVWTFQNISGISTLQASTQDGVKLLGRAGGTSSYSVTITPAALTGSKTATIPDVTGTFVIGATSTTATQAMFATSTAGAPAFRAIATGDLPTITASIGGTGLNTSASTGVPSISSGTWSVASTLGVTLGGTGRATSTTAYGLLAAGTTATGAHQTLAAGATTEILVGGGSSALPVWTTATGTGAPVRGTSPDFTTSITTASTSFTAFAGATTLLTIGGTGASASMFAPSTLDATSSTTGAIRTSGGISAAKALNVGTTGTFGGQIITIAGAVGAPSVSPTGDLDTGIWFPAANTFATSVGGIRGITQVVSGTGVLTGFNSSSPSATIHAINPDGNIPFRLSNSANTQHCDFYPPLSDGINIAAAFGTATNQNFGIYTNNSAWWCLFTTNKYLKLVSAAGAAGLINEGALIVTPQALTTAAGAGAINLTTTSTEVTTTGVLDALSLANGTAGQIKTIIHKAGAFTSVLTPTTALGFTTITFSASLGQSCTLQYTSAGWVILAVGGLTLPVIA